MKYFILFILTILSLCSYGQRGKTRTLSTDTLNGADTIYIPGLKATGSYNTLAVTYEFTQLGGTSDGTLTMQGGDINPETGDTLWIGLTTSDLFIPSSNDTATIIDGGISTFIIIGTPLEQYRGVCIGTAGDTTEVKSIYTFK